LISNSLVAARAQQEQAAENNLAEAFRRPPQ
jgi:hypothetical protein